MSVRRTCLFSSKGESPRDVIGEQKRVRSHTWRMLCLVSQGEVTILENTDSTVVRYKLAIVYTDTITKILLVTVYIAGGDKFGVLGDGLPN